MIVQAPDHACPKCGAEGWDGPHYRTYTFPGYVSVMGSVLPQTSEWLGWTCMTCGYEQKRRTLDAPPPMPAIVNQTPPLFPPNREITEPSLLDVFCFWRAWRRA